MKKRLFLIIIVIFSISMANAEEVEIDGINYKLIKKINEAEVIKKENKYKGEIVIPSYIEFEGVNYKVTSIGDEAFHTCMSLTSVSIPNSINKIGEWAFYSCINLKSIDIPNSVITIGGTAFALCSKIRSVIIPNSVTSIGHYTFQSCTNLETVEISDNVTSIGMQCFYGCSNLIFLTLPKNLEIIAGNAFKKCTALKSVEFPNSVIEIGIAAFSGCYSLTSVTFGNSIRKIDSHAFEYCENIGEVVCYSETIPNTAYNAFEGSYINYANLFVPFSSIEEYKSKRPWSNFGSINAIDGTAIESVEIDNNEIKKVYSLDGKLRNTIKKGVNIIQMNDGKTKKVIVK